MHCAQRPQTSAIAKPTFCSTVQAGELLRQVAAVDPADYERQMAATAGSVRAVGTFIAELADRSVDIALCNSHSREVVAVSRVCICILFAHSFGMACMS
jgi:hypothetical protein